MDDRMELAKSLSDGFVYRILRTEKERDHQSENYGRKVIRLERVTDGYQDSIQASFFERAFASISEQEAKELIIRYLVKPQPGDPRVRLSPHAEETSEPQQEHTQDQQLTTKVGILIEPDASHDFSKMICYPETIAAIQTGLNKIRLRDFLDNDWGLAEVSSKTKQSIINLYGPPGTGKTMAAYAIGRHEKKKVLLVNYAELESKWVGETGKHISQVFAEAKRVGAIIFWDEADSMLSARMTHTEDAVSKSANTNRNIIMQEMDRYEGIMICASNFYESYDPAMVRRISQHVQFELPNREMRAKLMRLKIPSKVPLADVNFEEIAKLAEGFSGDDIRKLCEQALVKAASLFDDSDKNKRILRQADLIEALERIQAEKANHKGGSRKIMGIHAAS